MIDPYTLSLIIYGMLGFILVLMIVFAFYFRKEILSFIFPNDWADITMLEADNTYSSWLQKKNKDLRFTFNDGLYNMYETVVENKRVPTPEGNYKNMQVFSGKRNTAVYRAGRLSKFVYIEGNENPVDLRHLQISGNPQMTKQLQAIDITKLWASDTTLLEDIWQKYGLIILIVGLGIIAFMILGNNQGPQV